MGFHKSHILSGLTALQQHIKSGKTAAIASGQVTGAGYFPGRMKFNGSTGYFTLTGLTNSGNKVSGFCQFMLPSSASDQRIMTAVAGSTLRFALTLKENDHANADVRGKLQVFCQNSGGSTVCRVQSATAFNDNALHSAFVEYDGDAGTCVMRVDGNNEVDSGNSLHVLTTGALATATASFYVGGSNLAADFCNGLLGSLGYRDAGGLSWSDFMYSDGTPKPLDETTWAQWGAQPKFWHEAANMAENLGSAGAMIKNGTITLASAQTY